MLKYLCPFVNTLRERVKSYTNMIFSVLWFFYWFSGVKVEPDLYQMFETLLRSYFGLDHTSSLEIIHRGIEDRQLV